MYLFKKWNINIQRYKNFIFKLKCENIYFYSNYTLIYYITLYLYYNNTLFFKIQFRKIFNSKSKISMFPLKSKILFE